MSEFMITLEDAAASLGALVDRVAAGRETAVVVKAGRPVVRMIPVPTRKEASDELIGFLRHWRSEYPEPDEQLAQVIHETRQAMRPPKDPWD
jgi:prevent-host-death family protein